MALCVLAAMISSSHGQGQSLAVECLIQLSNRDRIDLPKFGIILGRLHTSGGVKTNRWAKAFASTAAQSPRYVGVVAALRAGSPQRLSTKGHKDLGTLLETLQ
jgi:hypothetical protein